MASANSISKGDLADVMRAFIKSDLRLIEDHTQRDERKYQELLVIAEGLEGVREDAFYQAVAARLETVGDWREENEQTE